MFYLIFMVTLLIISGLSALIFNRIYRLLPLRSSWIATIIALVAIYFVIAWPLTIFFGEYFPISVTSWLYLSGASWIIIMIYYVLIFLGIDLFRLVNGIFHWVNPRKIRRLTDRNSLLFILIVGGISLSMILGNIHYHHKKVLKLPVRVSEQSLDSIKMIGLSDLHLGYTIQADEFSEWVDLINAEKPDMVLLSGDIIDNNIRPLLAQKEQYQAIFSRIHAPLGVYAVLGNHEYIGDLDANIEFLHSMGITLLRDEVITVNDSMVIIGRDDKMNPKRASLESLVAKINPNDQELFTIVLDHQPYTLQESIDHNIDLHFSGHSHEGQIWPYSWMTKYLYKIDHGTRHIENTYIAVSSGIGIWGGKFRIGTQSEYVLFELNYHNNNE